MKNQQTTELIEELSKDGIPSLEQNQQLTEGKVVRVVHGGNQGGTYVCKELIYAYATWVSPNFFLLVLRTFDQVMLSNRFGEDQMTRDYFFLSVEREQSEAQYQRLLEDKAYALVCVADLAEEVLEMERMLFQKQSELKSEKLALKHLEQQLAFHKALTKSIENRQKNLVRLLPNLQYSQ